jgi:hypothetical protein
MKATAQISTQPKVKYLVVYQGKGAPTRSAGSHPQNPCQEKLELS